MKDKQEELGKGKNKNQSKQTTKSYILNLKEVLLHVNKTSQCGISGIFPCQCIG